MVSQTSPLCPYCGFLNEEGVKICKNCGNNLDLNQVIIDPAAAMWQGVHVSRRLLDKPLSSKPGVIRGLIFMGILWLIVCIFTFSQFIKSLKEMLGVRESIEIILSEGLNELLLLGFTVLITYFWLKVAKKIFTGKNKKGFFEK
ncbi:zinc ribbon domain-containing protein [Carboxydothermus pertinax]|uniref:Zinc ribbon domain-containing protein n=1 Tax=Carboxydothermus pertinax TaxID=870242 RepID=A0A1L8CYC9_9THEO|nr:zinc ribbon domain-containing protein [Carboxydothermus pertinax]GAV23874.1 zinc ribbon domain-containing protein [Carboxydothermus pertinax]